MRAHGSHKSMSFAVQSIFRECYLELFIEQQGHTVRRARSCRNQCWNDVRRPCLRRHGHTDARCCSGVILLVPRGPSFTELEIHQYNAMADLLARLECGFHVFTNSRFDGASTIAWKTTLKIARNRSSA